VAARTEYQARYQTQEFERDRPTQLLLQVYAAGSLSAPSSGTVSVYNASNTAVVSGAAVTVTGNVATYELLASTVAAEVYGAGWRVVWSLVMDDTNTHTFREDGQLVRHRLHPVIADVDLTDLYSDLVANRPSALASFESYILAAWRDIVDRLETNGRRPALIMTPRALRLVHLHLALTLIFNDWAGGGDVDNKWVQLRDRHEQRFDIEWSRLSFNYDAGDDGVGNPTRRRSGQPQLWLAGRG